ncbi:MAG TPA: M15 family metallopeptidase [Acidimicrobiia bacterium]|jgi:hypothetical protein
MQRRDRHPARALLLLLFVIAACSRAAGVPREATTTSVVLPSVTAPATSASSTTFDASTTSAAPTTVTTPTTTAAPPTTVAAGEGWYLAWAPVDLPAGFVDGAIALPGVAALSPVRVGNGFLVETRDAAGGIVDEAPETYVIPVEVHVLDDPVAHARFVPPDIAALVRGLGPDEVLLGETSARIRRLGTGATLTFRSRVTVTVAGVVADEYVGDAEVVTTRDDPEMLAAVRERYVVLRHPGPGPELERALAGVTDEPVQVRAWGETLVLRHGDAVRSQAAMKERFGEFAVRTTGDGFVQDPAWHDANIVRVDLALLGTFECHRDFAEVLEGVMSRLVVEGHGDVIDLGAFAGCYNARFIAGRTDLSHHAWGAAADINIYNALDGAGSPVDPALLEAMYEAGLTSGHAWILPDPGHFEWFDDGPLEPGTPARP